MFAPSFADILAQWDEARTSAREPSLVSPSDLGNGCDRRTMYRATGAEPDARDNRKAIVGTLIHGGARHAIEAAGGIVEVACDYPHPGLGVGHADIVWPDDGTVDDIKSKSDRAFTRWLTHGPDEGELRQARAYAWSVHNGRAFPDSDHMSQGERERAAIRLLKTVGKVDTVRIVAVNRDTGESQEFVEAYDDERAWEAVVLMGRLASDIADGVDIPRQGNGPGTGFPCDWCEFVRECWNMADVPAGRSPQSAGIDVADPEWVAAASDYLEAQQAEAKAKDAKAANRMRLVGVPGEADGLKVAWQGGRTIPATVEPDPDAMEVLIQEAGWEVPVREVPERTTPLTIRVTRTRVQ